MIAEGSTDVIALEFQSFVFNLKSGGSITGTICDILYYVSTCASSFSDPNMVTDNMTERDIIEMETVPRERFNGVPAGQSNKTFPKLAEEGDD